MHKKTFLDKIMNNIKFFYNKTSKKDFSRKELGSDIFGKRYDSFKDIFSFKFNIKTIILSVVFFICVGIVFSTGRFLIKIISPYFDGSASVLMNVVSKSLGEPMKKDEFGNINALLIGFGGDGHAGAHLADTIILVSYSTINNTVTMISIPRDLYIYEKGKYSNKINSVFAFEYNNSQGSLDIAAKKLSQKVGEIFGTTIPYYALVDFKGFKTLVDSIGGLEIDIPYTIHDVEYPIGEHKYGTFHINAGLQKLDGETALRYARSRHSTSDFSRSARQQLIIKSIIHKIIGKNTLTSPSAIKNLYQQYKNMIYTNISMENMLWGLKFVSKGIPQIFSFGLTMECMDVSYKTVQPGCLLYNGVRADFGGMSVLLPRGATKWNPSYYDYTSFFASIVTRHPGFLKENAKIAIYNAINKRYSRNFRYRNGLASKLSAKLRRYAFNIIDVDNSDKDYELTTAIINGQTGEYKKTLYMLKSFFDIPNVIYKTTKKNILTGNKENFEDYKKVNTPDIEIYLGNDFIKRFGNKRFDMYKK